MKGIVGLAVKVALAGVVVIGSIAGVIVLKQRSDDRRNEREQFTVVDEPSGITWEMYGEPELVETTSDLAVGGADGFLVDVRIYTVDHGSWLERVQVFSVPPGEIDFTQAALSTFGADPSGELGGLEFVKIGGFDAATGTAPGTIERDGEEEELSSQVFAAQMNASMVTGGVAQVVGEDDVVVADEAADLRETIFAV